MIAGRAGAHLAVLEPTAGLGGVPHWLNNHKYLVARHDVVFVMCFPFTIMLHISYRVTTLFPEVFQ